MSTSSTPAPAPGQPIPTPLDFPVIWDDPRDANFTWKRNPRDTSPIAPLSHAVVSIFLAGGNAGLDHADLPFKVRNVRLNTYEYFTMVPTAAPPDGATQAMGLLNRAAPGVFKLETGQTLAGMSKEQEAALNRSVERLGVYWLDELLPEIKQHIAYFESCDLRGLSLDQLRAHLTEALQRVGRMGALHKVVIVGTFAMSQFEELYRELFPGATTLQALRLLQGFDNKTMQGDRALWRLGRAALAAPEVHAILSAHAAGEVITALEKSAAGQRFLADLRAWFAQYGQRLDSVFALSEPSWIEDPTRAIEYLQVYLRQPEPPRGQEHSDLAAEREQGLADARAILTGYPHPVVTRFETLLKAAQMAVVINEDHNVWIDQRLFYHVRRLILEFGGRLAQAGTLAKADDVFCLTPEEMETGQDASLKGLVQERQAEMERFSHVTAPSMLGTMPAFEIGDLSPMMRAMFKGEMSPPNTSPRQAHQVQGLAGSAGVARGTARVLHSLAEAGKLRPGDVLIAALTVPPWTPLFATAAAVVTDTGGVLSHCAIVAREYRIPAVVGTGTATTTFKDGELLEVDGDAGTVRAVVDEAEHELALAG